MNGYRLREAGLTLAAIIALALAPAALAASDGGSLQTAQFPDVLEFDFDKVNENYERATENLGKVTPILDEALGKGQAAVEAGEKALADPTDDNKRSFVAAVLGFVRGAADGKVLLAELTEDVRSINSQTGILYAQATTQTTARLDELRKEFQREEIRFKDLVARNKALRREGKLSDWELRKLFEEEKRQAQTLNRIAGRVAFQQDFLKALQKAGDRSGGDFTLYEQFLTEATDALTDISDLAANLPIVVERLQVASAMANNMPSRKAAVAGFAKVEKARALTKQLADQLMKVCSGDLTADDADPEVEQVVIRRAEAYKRWLDGESVEYRKPPRASK